MPTRRGCGARIFEQIKSLGFNTVRTWVEWSHGEPRRGEYHLEHLDLLLRLAHEVGLKVIVQVYVDSAPEWVGRLHPDGRFVAQSGDVIASQAAPGFCVDHDGVRRVMLGFVAEVARHASVAPAFHAYDVWSEPAVMNWAQPAWIPGAQYLLLPAHAGALQAVAPAHARVARRAQPRVVPHVQRLERGRAAALRHHPDLCRLHGLAHFHRRKDRR